MHPAPIRKQEKTTITQAGFFDSLYCLLLFLLICSEESLDKTHFFFGQDFPHRLVGNFKHKTYVQWPSSAVGKAFALIGTRVFKYIRYPFLKTATLYGQDNLQMTSALIGHRKLHVVEDGVINYTLSTHRRHRFLKRLIGGRLMGDDPFGNSDCVEKLYLTGLSQVPEEVKEKVEFINPQQLWKEASVQKQDQIFAAYNLTRDQMEKFRSIETLLITQPLSEDGVLSEEEKILLYRNLMGDKNFAIKPHPREKTNYNIYFPQHTILDNLIPMELLNLCNIRFKEVFTIFSTAALSFPYDVQLHFAGTSVHPKLVEKFGKVSFKNGKIVTERN